jgi:hypothetical protein
MTRTECTYEITKLVELNVDYKRKSASVYFKNDCTLDMCCLNNEELVLLLDNIDDIKTAIKEAIIELNDLP